MNNKTRFSIEIFGAASIVASLIFVGIQLIQDRTVARGAQFDNRAAAGIQMHISRFENDAYIQDVVDRWEHGAARRWFNEDVQAFQDRMGISDKGLYRLNLSVRMSAINFDNNFYQYQLGLMDEEDWLSIRANQKRTLQSPLNRAVYQTMDGMRPQAKLEVSRIISELETTN